MQDRVLGSVAAIFGGLAVILGAMAAHALHDTLVAADTLDSWKTASIYHLTHAIVVLFLAQQGFRKCGWTMLAGVLLFSGSIYVLCLVDGVSWLGPVTPLGGVLMIAAWFSLAMAYLRKGA